MSLGHSFSDPALLRLALTHRSLGNESGDHTSNERLEFLGDAVLSLVISHLLFQTYPQLPEGELSRMRAGIVNANALAEKARAQNLGEGLRMSQGELSTGGRDKASLLADAYEAVLGAIYLDGGFAAAQKVIERIFGGDVQNAEAHARDPKTALQEWCQKHHHTLPSYRLVSELGPEHDRSFECEVTLGDKVLGRGSGRSKKFAEQAAAKAALQALSAEPR